MKFSKKASLLLSSIAFSVLIITACSDENNVTEASTIQSVVSTKDLEKCSEKNAGEMVFISDSASFYYCAEGKWNVLNGKDGSNTSSVETPLLRDTIYSIDTIFSKDTIIGLNGASCTSEKIKGGYKIVCGGDSVGVVLNGADGKDALVEYDTVTTDFLNQDMLANGGYGILVDKRDNKVYRSVKIGTQTWMAQNLDYSEGGILSYCYDSDVANCKKFGKLYTWAAALNLDEKYNTVRATKSTGADSILTRPARGICPEGWHIPDSLEFAKLNEWVAANNVINYSSEGVSVSLKYGDTWTLRKDGTAGTNRYGFSVLGAGLHNYNTTYKGFSNLSTETCFWSASEVVAKTSVRAQFGWADYMNVANVEKIYAFSVRCLKDSE